MVCAAAASGVVGGGVGRGGGSVVSGTGLVSAWGGWGCLNRSLAPIRFRSAFFTSRVRLSLLPLFPALLPHTPAAAGNAHQCPEGNGACDFELCDACFCFNKRSALNAQHSMRECIRKKLNCAFQHHFVRLDPILEKYK